jgi:selenocysteine lyase/cysteine desulfurase
VDLALCIRWRRGERVVLFEGEFPANVTPWVRAAELFGLSVRFVPLAEASRDLEAWLGRLEAALRDGVRLVAVSAVQFQTGLRMPLERMGELCRRYGAELAVDAIQACGVVPVDVERENIDYLVCGAHKWMRGLEGAGFLYAREERARALEPRTAGWLSHENPVGFLLGGEKQLTYDRPIRKGIRFLEKSSLSGVSFAALGAGTAEISGRGVKAIFEHVTRYLNELEAGLGARGLASLRAADPALQSGILSFVPPAAFGAAKIAAGLGARGVTVSTPDGLVRFAPHFSNPLSEGPGVLGALDEVLAELRAGVAGAG